ncbi:shikimate kinase [Kineosporia sp. R_H_3]|uniref:shikimate kinase n=1 Tax=Kineosporia sp. R_H_3 TaxID=1961848 RepID=UPI000B4B9B75|nr:shikimate kinase [Kineosporia sp. R_H_3]
MTTHDVTDPVTQEHHDPVPGVPVVVTGLMGAGKTTVATALARRWGRALRDSDVDLQAATGRTAAELVAERGADGLHALEAQHVLDAVAAEPAAVVACAAFVVEVPECREALAGRAVVVWLDARPEELVARQHLGGHRPQYGPDLLEMLRGMDARRRPLFEQVADVAVRLDPVDPAADVATRQASVAALVDDVERRVVAAAGRRADR